MNIEESIEYLKNYKYDNEVRQAIETLLTAYEKEKETSHKKWENKIKAKIEELDKEEKQQLKGTKGQDRYSIKQEYMHKRSGVQLLLEKE